MPGMKRDCGGAAGILGAFRAAVKAVGINFASYVACLEAQLTNVVDIIKL